MAIERTFAIIKPDAVAAGHAGEILDAILKAGLAVRGMKLTRLTPAICNFRSYWSDQNHGKL